MNSPRKARRMLRLTELTAGVALVSAGIVAAVACNDKPPLSPLPDAVGSTDDGGAPLPSSTASQGPAPTAAPTATTPVATLDASALGLTDHPAFPTHTNYSPTYVPTRPTAAPISTAPPPVRTNR